MESIAKDSGLFLKAENQIKAVCPDGTSVEIFSKKILGTHYRTKITVNMPSRNLIVATKVSDSLSKSVEFTVRAALSQLRRIKTKRLSVRLAKNSARKIFESQTEQSIPA